MKPLIRNKLSAAGKSGVPGGKIEDRGDHPVHMHIWISRNEPHHARRLLGKREPRRRDWKASYIHQRPAAVCRYVANVSGVAVEVAEESEDGAQSPDSPRG